MTSQPQRGSIRIHSKLKCSSPQCQRCTCVCRCTDESHSPIPDWFRALELNAAGRATPSWNVSSHLKFMSEHHIAHSVLCVSTPQADAFLAERHEVLRKKKTVALARLLNSFTAELCRIYPERFSWLAIMPLPHVEESITELKRMFGLVGKQPVGVGVLTNHEGMYPGDETFDPLWEYLKERSAKMGGDGREVVFVHPTEPIIKLDDGRLINSRPCEFSYPKLGLTNDQESELTIHPSTPSLRSRRILLRNRARHLESNSLIHIPQVPVPPLPHFPRRRRFPRYLRAFPSRFPQHRDCSKGSLQNALLVR